jgi:hypothetical protein
VQQQVLKTASLLTKCNQYTSGAPYLLSGVLDRELLKSHGVHSSHTENKVFREKEGFINKCGYSNFQYRLSENSPLHVRKTRPHQRKTLTVDQLLHRYIMKKLITKSILANRSRSFKALTSDVLLCRGYNDFVTHSPDI